MTQNNNKQQQPMIIASAGYYGLLPRALEFAGARAAADALAAFQTTGWGLAVYGALVFAMEFLPFGAVNPAEVSEYFSAVRHELCVSCVVCVWRGRCRGVCVV
jgi:hypothetical protein